MPINSNPPSFLTTTPMMDSSARREPPNPEVEEMIRKLKEIDDGFTRSNQALDRSNEALDRNIQRLDNLGKKWDQIEEGVQELQYYHQTALQRIFGGAVWGIQRMKEMGSSIVIRIAEYPKTLMLLSETSQPVESHRDPDNASSPAQSAGKKKSASDFSLG